MSTVKVDTIQTTGGVSEIAIDKLKGVSAASSISVVGEGGTTTTNMQQGLAKSWWQYDHTNDTTDGSFNVSSINDDATGLYTTTLTNAQSSITDRCVNLTTNWDTGETFARVSCLRFTNGGSYTTSAISVLVYYVTSSQFAADQNHNFGTVYGDLA